MSQETVELVRRLSECWGRQDWDGAAELCGGKKSGIELEVDTALVVDVRNGRVTRFQGYMDRAEALKATGLSE